LIGKYISFGFLCASEFEYAKLSHRKPPIQPMQPMQPRKPRQPSNPAIQQPTSNNAVNCQSNAACRAFGLQFVKCLSRGFSFGRSASGLRICWLPDFPGIGALNFRQPTPPAPTEKTNTHWVAVSCLGKQLVEFLLRAQAAHMWDPIGIL